MAKFKRKPRRSRKRSPYSADYIAQQRDEMYRLLGSAKTDAERDAITKAYSVSIKPYR